MGCEILFWDCSEIATVRLQFRKAFRHVWSPAGFSSVGRIIPPARWEALPALPSLLIHACINALPGWCRLGLLVWRDVYIHALLQTVKKIIRLKVSNYCAKSCVSWGCHQPVPGGHCFHVLQAELPGLAWMSWAAGINLATFCQSASQDCSHSQSCWSSDLPWWSEISISTQYRFQLVQLEGGTSCTASGLRARDADLLALMLAAELFCPYVFCCLVSWLNSASKEPFALA